MTSDEKKLFQQSKKRERENAIAAGFYDGRFKQKVVKDKRKEQSKNHCKNFKHETHRISN